MNRAERIKNTLGMPHGTANNKLRKNILFKYVKKAGEDFCYVCGLQIENVDDLSIEHISPWEGRSAELFWDLDNIAFSHLSCNKAHYYNPTNKITSPEGYAWCGRCKQHLPVSDFRVRLDTHSGYEYRCNSCRIEAQRERRAQGKR